MKLREAVADAVVAEGTEVVFALMGDGNFELISDLAERHGVDVVFGRHEQGVVAMADGYARFAGRPGVATVTQGPGLTNTATSLVVAQRRRSPVLVLAGDTSAGDLHNPQGFDQVAFGNLMAGASARIEAVPSFEEILGNAFYALRSDRPFVLNLPADVQGATIDPSWQYQARYVSPQPVMASPEAVNEAAAILRAAHQPAVIAGRGAVSSGAGPVLKDLAELLAAPLSTTMLANGLFADHQLNAGVCGGLGDGRALAALETADVVVAVGASLSQWTTHFGSAIAGRRLIQIDTDPSTVAHDFQPDVMLQGDASTNVTALVELLRSSGEAPASLRAELRHVLGQNEPRDPSPYLDTDESLDPRRLLDRLDRALPARRSVVIGGGHCAQIACFTIRASSARDWACTSLDFGALGQGLATAVGACYARPGQRVTHITGDGDLMMGYSELDTAIRYSLPLTIVVLNDQAMGQERHNLHHLGLPGKYAGYPSPDFTQLGRALGATTYRIDQPDHLDRLDNALEDHRGVVIVDARINGEYLNPVSREIAEHLG